ncbi:sugar ABC transporter substrate-binding protein [Glaciibacter superstes]|uniref:sugar ABC transporter substrate-binding protein n=1 Tax=Glaciibacter superstes TaxID=501023 RepID=UPI0003B30299|nr:sugar ABC transporter substrate-binding protein [Glaciibacter superstes]
MTTHTAPTRTAPRRTAPTRTAPRRTAPRRTAVLALAAALPMILLAGCSSAAEESTEGKTIELSVLDYYTDEPSHSNMEKRLTACAADVDATIDHQSVPSPQLNAKILQQISTKTLPDILMVNNPDLPQFAETGALRPLTELDVDTSAFYPSVLEVGKYKDELYGLAPNVNSLALFYNKTMLDEAGVAVPTTWDELGAAAATLTQGDRYGFAYSAASGTEGTWTFIPFLWSNGGSQLELDAPEAIEALDFYTGLARDGYVSKSVVNWSQADAKDQFTSGLAAMMINGPWQIPSLEETEGLEWGSTTIPVPAAGDTPIAPLGGELWTVPVTTPDREARAASVIECLNGPENQLETALTNNTVPSNESVAQELIAQAPLMESIVETVSTANSLTSDSGLKWNDVNAALSAAIQAAVTGQQTPEEALKTAQSTVGE